MQSKASNSVMTRARAKYGCRLSKADFESLAGLTRLHDTASFLRTRTHYAPYFESLANAPELSRLLLESTLKKAFFDEAQKLCGFEKSVGNSIFRYYLLSRETELIFDYIMNLSRGTPEKSLLRTPPAENGGTKIDFAKLFQITETRELLKYLSKTKYAKLIAVLPKTDGGSFDLALIEATLERIKYDILFADIKKNMPSETATLLCYNLRMRIELTDFNMIYRAKKYYSLPESTIRANMIGYRCLLSQKAVDSIISAPDAREAMEIFKKSRYSSRAASLGTEDFELFCEKAVLDSAIRQIHFSSDPAIVLAAFLQIMQNECDNIIKIIEGIVYKVPKDEILSNLIII